MLAFCCTWIAPSAPLKASPCSELRESTASSKAPLPRTRLWVSASARALPPPTLALIDMFWLTALLMLAFCCDWIAPSAPPNASSTLLRLCTMVAIASLPDALLDVRVSAFPTPCTATSRATADTVPKTIFFIKDPPGFEPENIGSADGRAVAVTRPCIGKDDLQRACQL